MRPTERIGPLALMRGALPLLARLPQVVRGHRLTNVSDIERCQSIGTVLEDNARRLPDHPALWFEGRDISHAELNARANRIARALDAAGVGRGDRVGILLDNRPELIECVAGIVKLGAIAVVHNTRLPPAALAHCVQLSPGIVSLVGEELVETWEAARREAEDAGGHRFFVADGDAATVPDGYDDLARAARSQSDANWPGTAEIRLGEPCFHLFTSGTTGLPKAAVIRHIRWIKAMGAFGFMALGFRPGQVLYNVLPFYHGTALSVGWGACAATGACLAIGRRFSASHFIDELRDCRADGFVYIGELCRFLLNQPPSAADRDHSVGAMLGNGLRPEIWREFKQRFGVRRVYELYGASEANIAFFNILNQDSTVGLCPADYALVECDHATGELERDGRGRLLRVQRGGTGLLLGKVTGTYPYDGYTDPSASEDKLVRDAFEDGDCWFNTGDLLKDLGFRHARFVDRLGDTFRWRGENVATTEVEAIAMAVAEIDEAAAFGVRIPACEGRAGMLAFRPADPARTEVAIAALAAAFQRRLPDYAVPVLLRRVERVDATGTFKFVRKDLARQAWHHDEVADPMWIRRPGQTRYEPFTPELAAKLEAGELGF
jgi:citronellyl-CoA synthetase